jgi:hypothetical protein
MQFKITMVYLPEVGMITLPSLHAWAKVLTMDVLDRISRRSCMLNRSGKSGQWAVRRTPGLTWLKLGNDKLSVDVQRIRLLPQLLSNYLPHPPSTFIDTKKLLIYLELGETGQSIFYCYILPRVYAIYPYRHLHILTQSIFITNSIVVKFPWHGFEVLFGAAEEKTLLVYKFGSDLAEERSSDVWQSNRRIHYEAWQHDKRH